MRIVASAIVILAGAICVAVPLTVHPIFESARAANTFGWYLVAAGAICFVIEFIRTWKRSETDDEK